MLNGVRLERLGLDPGRRHTVCVGDHIVGRPVNAVLAPPQAERFAAVAGADLNRLVLNVTAFRLRHALGLLADPGDPAVLGTIEEHLAQL